MVRRRMRAVVVLVVVAAMLEACSLLGAIGAADGPPFEPVEEIPEGKALIYVFKPGWYGKAVYEIMVNGHSITVLEKRGYRFLFVPAGHTYISTRRTLRGGGYSGVNFEARSGERYYLRMASGFRTGFEMVAEEEALEELEVCVLLPRALGVKIEEENEQGTILSTAKGKLLFKRTAPNNWKEVLEFLAETPFFCDGTGKVTEGSKTKITLRFEALRTKPGFLSKSGAGSFVVKTLWCVVPAGSETEVLYDWIMAQRATRFFGPYQVTPVHDRLFGSLLLYPSASAERAQKILAEKIKENR